MPRARDLSRRIRFEARELVDDGMGNEVSGGFRSRFTVAAEVRAKFGGEAVIAARLSGQQPATITVRQSTRTPEITTNWRGVDDRDGTVYDIKSIADPDDDGRWLELLCSTGGAP